MAGVNAKGEGTKPFASSLRCLGDSWQTQVEGAQL